MDSAVFEQLSPTKLFFRCAVPSMISMAVGSLYSIADGVFVGRFIGEGALAAVNLVMPLIMILFALSNMIATGASVRISMLLGQKDRDGACLTFTFSVKIIAAISIVLGIVGFAFAEPIVRLLGRGASAEAIRYGVEYLKVHAVFMPLLPLCFATDNFLRVCGKEKLSMALTVSSQLLNILLDVILIGILHQGIWAAAFTSCVSMALVSVITLLLFAGKKFDLYYVKGFVPPRQFLKIAFNGSSEFFGNIANSIMSLVLNFFLLHYGGTTAVAAMSVVMYADGIIGMLIFGMCDALQPAISYCYSAKQIKKVRAIERRVLGAAALLSLAALLFMRYAGRFVAPLFVKTEDVALFEVSLAAMRLFSLSYLFGWVDMCLSSYFTALEKPMLSLLLSFAGTLVFPIGCLALMSPVWGITGVWLMPAVSGFLSAMTALLLYLRIRNREYTDQTA